jgi:hypothetical protein
MRIDSRMIAIASATIVIELITLRAHFFEALDRDSLACVVAKLEEVDAQNARVWLLPFALRPRSELEPMHTGMFRTPHREREPLRREVARDSTRHERNRLYFGHFWH